jgi:hypothetical protein
VFESVYTTYKLIPSGRSMVVFTATPCSPQHHGPVTQHHLDLPAPQTQRLADERHQLQSIDGVVINGIQIQGPSDARYRGPPQKASRTMRLKQIACNAPDMPPIPPELAQQHQGRTQAGCSYN